MSTFELKCLPRALETSLSYNPSWDFSSTFRKHLHSLPLCACAQGFGCKTVGALSGGYAAFSVMRQLWAERGWRTIGIPAWTRERRGWNHSGCPS